MSNQDELISQFIDITGATEDRARFFLSAANWTMQLALTGYYESDPEAGDVPVETIDDDSDEELQSIEPKEKEEAGQQAKPKKSQPSTNVVTLHSMNRSSSEDEEEQGQAFYAGGSERSGQQVLGPPKRNPIKDYVSEIFRSAQESGAEIVDPHTRHAHAGSSSDTMFGGSGYRLGMTQDDHSVLPSTRPSRPQNIEPIIIKLWRQGLSINDGDLRPYDQPENREFLNSIMRGEIPAELRKMGGATVHVDLEDHRTEEFKQGKKKVHTFTGAGHTLGSPAPSVTTEPTAPSPAAASPSVNADAEKKANEELAMDAAQPNTMIQIRLADGSRLQSRFNHTHTVNDIRRFIMTARPNYEAVQFNLLTTFPSKELTDGEATIKDAGLLNAAILQRLK